MAVYSRRYLLVHGAFMVVVLCLLAGYGLDPGRALAKWDGQHYLQIASTGYDHKLTFLANGKPARMNIAFFPLYPLLMSLSHTVTRLPLKLCGLLISLLASLATAVGLGVLLEPLFGRRAALMTVTLWAVGIDAIVQSMLYGQSLIAALAVWGAIAARRRRYLFAALCAFGAGLTHSTGIGLIVVVMVGAALGIREAVRRKAWRAAAAPAAAFVLAPMGLLGYIVFLAVRFHRADAWFLAESAPGWNSQFDAGKYTLSVLVGQLDGSRWHGVNGVSWLIASASLVPAALVALWLLYDAEWWERLAARWPILRDLTLSLPARLRRGPAVLAPADGAAGGMDLTSIYAPSPATPAPATPAPATPAPATPTISATAGTTGTAATAGPAGPAAAPAATTSPADPVRQPGPRRPRVPWELTLAALVTLAVTLTDSGPWNSKPRFLIPCLALFVPAALWLDRLGHRPLLRWGIVLAVALVSVLCSFYMDGPSPAAL